MISTVINRKIIILFLLAGGLFSSCKQADEKIPEDYEVATAWADMTNYIAKTTPSNTPTFSRAV
jgi:hypothetical protein